MKDGFKGSRAIVIPDAIVLEMNNDLFTSRLHITDIGYFPVAALHKRKRVYGAPQHVLIYCTEGKGWVKIRDQKYNIEKNQFIILPANISHEYGASQSRPWTIYWIHFNGALAEFYAKDFSTPTSIIPSEESRIYDRLLIFEDIFTALGRGLTKDNINFATSALYYFLGSIKYINIFRGVADKHSQEKNIVDKALMYIQENIERNISLNELCEYVGYSVSHFTTLFKTHTNNTPVNYIIQIKMQEACKMLDLTDMKINQICYKIGIVDPYYFTRIFTKTIGITPSVYRKTKRGEII